MDPPVCRPWLARGAAPPPAGPRAAPPGAAGTRPAPSHVTVRPTSPHRYRHRRRHADDRDGQAVRRPDAETTSDTVAGPAGERLGVVTVGSGPTVAVLLHQTDRVASCGWWRFANRLAAQGVRAVLLDFCDYGVVDVRHRLGRRLRRPGRAHRGPAARTGASRVTVVGASLGGTVAAVSAAAARPDAVVDLSGFGFGPLTTGPALAALRVPVLGAGSHDEESDSLTLAGGGGSRRQPGQAVPVGHRGPRVCPSCSTARPATPPPRPSDGPSSRWVTGGYAA